MTEKKPHGLAGKPGNRRLHPDRTTSETVHIRAAPADKRRWTIAAQRQGQTLTAWLTALANAASAAPHTQTPTQTD